MGPLILQQTGSPKQIYERQMVAANERGEREGAMEGSLEGGGKVKRGVRWETCRWISLRSGAGLFNEQAHSSPPSSVAPAARRPSRS